MGERVGAVAEELENRPRLVIVCGLPGSGKTVHAKRVEQSNRAIRFCPDEWMDALGIDIRDSAARGRIEKLQWTIAQQLLCLGQRVVIEWGTWARSERDELRVTARNLGAAVELHFLDAPVEVLFERIQRRNAESPPITLEQMKTWANVFERPSPEEMALYDYAARL